MPRKKTIPDASEVKRGPCGCFLGVATKSQPQHGFNFPLSPAGWHSARAYAKGAAMRDQSEALVFLMCGHAKYRMQHLLLLSCTRNGFCHTEDEPGYEQRDEPLAGWRR